jgi:hypothetical protein
MLKLQSKSIGGANPAGADGNHVHDRATKANAPAWAGAFRNARRARRQ